MNLWTSPWWETSTNSGHQVGVSTCLAHHAIWAEVWLKGVQVLFPLLPWARVPPFPESSPTGGLGRKDAQSHLPLVGTSLMDPPYLHLQARMVEKSHQMVLGGLHLGILLGAIFLEGYPSPQPARTGQWITSLQAPLGSPLVRETPSCDFSYACYFLNSFYFLNAGDWSIALGCWTAHEWWNGPVSQCGPPTGWLLLVPDGGHPLLPTGPPHMTPAACSEISQSVHRSPASRDKIRSGQAF